MHKWMLWSLAVAVPLALPAADGIGGDSAGETVEVQTVVDRAAGLQNRQDRAPAVVEQQTAVSSRRARALENFIRASMKRGTDEQCIDWLLAALMDDPGSGAACALLNTYAENPAHLEKIIPGLLKVAEAHPDYPLLTEQLLALSFRHPLSPEQVENLIGRVVAAQQEPEKLDPRSRQAFCRILEIYVGGLLSDDKIEEATALFQRLNARRGFAGRPRVLELAAEFYNLAARQADRDRRWLGLLPSDRELMEERRDEFVQALRETDERVRNLPELERRAVTYLRLQLADDAVRVVEQAVKRAPLDTASRYLLARVLFMARRYKAVLPVVSELLKESPDNRDFLELQADSALRCGRYDLVAEAAGKMLKMTPDDPGAEFLRISGLLAEGKLEEAEAAIKAVKDEEFRENLYIALQLKARNFDQMLAALKRHEKRQGDKVTDTVYTMMLLPAERTGDVELLNYCWNKLAAMDALEDPENANSVGYVAAVLNVRLDEAEKLIRYALESDPECGAYLDSMAWLLYRRGEYEEAADYIRRALSVPDELTAAGRGVLLDHAGDIMMKLGDRDAARAYYEEAVAEAGDPDVDLAAIRRKLAELRERK